MEEQKTLERKFKDRLKNCMELADALDIELRAVQYLAERAYHTLDPGGIMNLCYAAINDAMSIIEKLDQIMNEDEH